MVEYFKMMSLLQMWLCDVHSFKCLKIRYMEHKGKLRMRYYRYYLEWVYLECIQQTRKVVKFWVMLLLFYDLNNMTILYLL